MLKEKLYSVLMRMCFLETPPPDDAMLKDDLGIDSLRMAEFIVALEEACGITVSENDLDPQRFRTVGDAYNVIRAYAGDFDYAV